MHLINHGGDDIDLVGADFSFAFFRCENFKGTNFQHANFTGIKLEDVTFSKCDFQYSYLYNLYTVGDNVNFQSSNFQEANIGFISDISKRYISNYCFSMCDLLNTNFQHCKSINAYFHICNLNGTNFNNANLKSARFQYCRLNNTCFDNANLEDADFFKSSFFKSSLHNANLKNVKLSNCDLEDADLRNSNLDNIHLKFITINENTKIDRHNLHLFTSINKD